MAAPSFKSTTFTSDRLNWTPRCGHHELARALSTDGRFGRLRRTRNRPAVVNAVVLNGRRISIQPIKRNVCSSMDAPQWIARKPEGAYAHLITRMTQTAPSAEGGRT